MGRKLIKYTKQIPLKIVFKTIGDINKWHNGKLYMPLKSITKKGRKDIKGAIQLGKSKKFLYTFDKKRRIKGFAPSNLIRR